MKSCNIFIKAGVNRQSLDYCLTYLGGFIGLGPTPLTRFFHNLGYFSYCSIFIMALSGMIFPVFS